jgi:hypothetical protein
MKQPTARRERGAMASKGAIAGHESPRTTRRRLSRWPVTLLHESLQQASGFGPDWAAPFLLAFPAESHTARCAEAKIASLQPHNFADAGTSVKHQAQEGTVAAAVAAIDFDCLQHRLDFPKVQVVDLTAAGALERNAQDALDCCPT